LPGKVVATEMHDWPKGFPNAEEDVRQFLVGAQVLEVKRRAKVLIIELNTKYSLLIHLKMTGQLVFIGKPKKSQAPNSTAEILKKVQNSNDQNIKSLGFPKSDQIRFGAGHPNDSLVGSLPDRSTRVTFSFTDGSQLFFNDQRKFGWVRLVPTAEIPNIDFFKRVGPEPLATDFTPSDFRARLMRRQNSAVKAVLLDQTVIAGIGNIYADESLWSAKIHPATPVKNISSTKLNTLFTALRSVLELSIAKGGSSDKNYVNAEGKKGSYLTFANVFRREGKPCPRHSDTLIIKTRVAGRGTHTCPKCQKVVN